MVPNDLTKLVVIDPFSVPRKSLSPGRSWTCNQKVGGPDTSYLRTVKFDESNVTKQYRSGPLIMSPIVKSFEARGETENQEGPGGLHQWF